MKFLCLGYFDRTKMDARPAAEIDAVMRACTPHLRALHATGRVMLDAGLDMQTRSLRRLNGAVNFIGGPCAASDDRVGSVFILEAQDMDEAVRLAALHPAAQVSAGEDLGWRIEVRPVHFLAQGGSGG